MMATHSSVRVSRVRGIGFAALSVAVLLPPLQRADAAAPSNNASNMSFSARSTSSVTVHWYRGDGGNCLLVGKQGATPTPPSDGTDYDYVTFFGFNFPNYVTATDSHCLYEGIGTNSTVTALQPDTSYTFSIFEFNGTGAGTEYKVDVVETETVKTLANEPTAAAQSVNFTALGSTNLTVNWTSGNGANRIVVMKAGAAVGWVPTDATSYSADTNFAAAADQGSGNKVVYSGTGSSQIITGLDPDTTYYVKVFEFNGSAGSENYRTSDPPSGNETTSANEPTSAPGNPSFSSIGQTSMALSWADGNGDYVLVVARQGGAPTDPSDRTTYLSSTDFGSGDQTAAGSYVVYKGSGTSVTVNNLSPNNSYTFHVYEFNGSSGSENYLTSSMGSGTQTTLATEPGSAAQSINFTVVGSTNLTVNWTSGSGASRIVVMKAGGAVGWAPTDGQTYSANTNFSSATDQGSGDKVVYSGSGASQIITGLSPDTVYYVKVYEFNGSSGSQNYRTSDPPSGSQTTTASEPTSAPGNPAFSSVGQTAMTLTWTDGNGDYVLVVARQGGTPADPTDTTTYTANSSFGSGDQTAAGSFVVYRGSGTNVTVNNLFPDNSYTFHVYEFNGSGGSENYLTSSKGSSTEKTSATEPNSPVTASVPSKQGVELPVWWSGGDADHFLVLVKVGSAVDDVPVDRTTYSADSNFGDGQQIGAGNYVCYSGSATNFTLKGITSSTTYHVAVFGYNGSGGSENYDPSEPARNSFRPTAVVLLNFGVGMEDGRGVVRWETSSELGTIAFNLERLVAGEWIRINGAPVPAKGWQSGGNGATYSVVDEGVVPGETYTYRLIEITGEGQEIYGPFVRVVQQQLRFEKGITVTDEGVRLRWLSRASDTYRIMITHDLVGGQWTPLVTGIEPTPPENVYVDETARTETVFYRVEVEE